jgi:hypothetical protein
MTVSISVIRDSYVRPKTPAPRDEVDLAGTSFSLSLLDPFWEHDDGLAFVG